MSQLKQENIKITDIYKNYDNSSDHLKKQMDFLFKFHSTPLTCPRCKVKHTWNEIVINEQRCPIINLALSLDITFIGGEQILKKA